MNIPDLLHAPWAITEARLIQMQEIYMAHLHKKKPDFEAIEKALGKPLDRKANRRRLLAFDQELENAASANSNANDSYQIVNGTAVIPIDGVISKHMTLFSRISGGTSHESFQSDFSAAMEDPLAHSILLLVESPGGEVDGTQASADMIYQARGVKPIAALADGEMASAAYWLGSAVDPGQLFMASDTTIMGSIGVITSHVDYSQRDAKQGIKVTQISAGKYKGIVSSHAPLSAEGEAMIQGLLDHAYSIFVNDVAQNRGVSPDQVVSKMAEGRVFMGQKAIDAGLADGKATAKQIIAQLADKRAAAKRSSSFPGTGSTPPPYSPNRMKGQETMSETKLTLTLGGTSSVISTQAELDAAVKAHNEASATALQAAKTEAFDNGKKAGREAETARIKAVEAQLMPGHEALVAELKFDGKTTGPEAAEKVLAAEKKALNAKAGDLRADAAKPVESSTPDAKTEAEREKEKQNENTSASRTPEADANALADKIRAYRAEQAKLGNNVSHAQALAAVTKKK